MQSSSSTDLNGKNQSLVLCPWSAGTSTVMGHLGCSDATRLAAVQVGARLNSIPAVFEVFFDLLATPAFYPIAFWAEEICSNDIICQDPESRRAVEGSLIGPIAAIPSTKPNCSFSIGMGADNKVMLQRLRVNCVV